MIGLNPDHDDHEVKIVDLSQHLTPDDATTAALTAVNRMDEINLKK